VLDVQSDRILIITENIIEQRKYNNTSDKSAWETCDLRKYLNGEFLNELDMPRILTVANRNPEMWYGTKRDTDTQDSIFLLSLEDIAKYFGISGQLSYKNSEEKKLVDDQYNQNRIAMFRDKPMWWWLRSGGSYLRTMCILDTGNIAVYGVGVSIKQGVRPALWLKLD
jgi:hypothetical protein